MSKIDKKSKKKNTPKNRKTLRKEKRKEKKQRKFEHYVNRKKPGQFVLNPDKLTEKLDKTNAKTTKVPPKTKNLSPKATTVDTQMKEIKKEKEVHKKLQKDMAKQRKKQLKEANLDEDRNIKQLEKQLKLNKRKNKSIPKSFASDGLDYLLEVCEPENVKGIAAAEQQFNDFNDEFEDDFALVTGKTKQSINTRKEEHNADSDSNLDQSDEEDVEQDESELNEENPSNSEDDLNEEEDSDEPMDFSDDLEGSDEENSDEEINENRKRKKKDDSKSKKVKETHNSDSDNENDSESEAENNEDDSDKKETWEDIYGRTRNKDGTVVTKTEGKYVPPALRALKENNSNVDQKRAEKLARLKKQLKGLLNRLAESNMHSISSQIEDMYMANSRNDMNETLTELIFEALIVPVTTPERLLLEYVLLITILHANIGTEVGAQFLQTVVNQFDELFKKDQPVENKQLDNTVHIIAQLYNFKVFHSQLLYQILAKLAEKFEEKHVECILLVLKNVGFSLRKDDPLALKQLILDLQKIAATVTDNSSRVKYMLDILLAIKNNNVSKIPNYDTTYSEHLKKLLKSFVRKGNYVTQLNISLDDLLKADERGRWWIVGSAWTGTDNNKHEKRTNTDTGPTFSQKLLELARKQRMNTDTRRNIFCSLMTAENYLDAFEKLLNLGLKNQQEREIIHVILHCNLQEKEYNPYYGLLAQKFCEYDRKYQMTIRCSIWDKLKTLTECSGRQISILARLLTYLFLNQGLPISILKVIEFSELDQVTLRLIRQVLIGILLHDNEEISLAVFEKVATSPKLKMFRESLRLFIHHFLLRNLNTSSLSDEHKQILTTRAKLAEKALTSSENKVKF